MKSRYRADIDGLRAIAVLSVLLFHVGLDSFSGGYVGVDVFFVISGFLITRLIRAEMVSTGQFSFSRFYIRRARRLFPALFFTLVLSILLARFFFAPQYLSRVGGALVHAMTSLSNFFFWSESGYFDTESAMKPLLHTWSLSVEEQFYLCWPLFIVFVLGRRSKRVAPSMLLAVGALSLFLNVVFADGKIALLSEIPVIAEWFADGPTTIYYLAPFRVFEFAIGAAVVWLIEHQPKNKLVLEPLVVAGLAMIATAVFTYTPATLFPSYNALLPCVGTALIIYAGTARYSGKLLSNWLAVKIGLISYSLYLIHWPIIVFYKSSMVGELGAAEQVLICVASTIGGTLMYRYIEQPFRRATSTDGALSPAGFGLACCLLALVIVTIGANVWSRTDAGGETAGETVGFRQCAGLDLAKGTHCEVRPAGDKILVVWGDSHARAFFVGGVPSYLSDYTIYTVSIDGCPSLVGIARDDRRGNSNRCRSLSNLKLNADAIRALKPDALFLVSWWALYTEGLHEGGKLQKDNHYLTDDPDKHHGSKAKSQEIMARQALATIEFFDTIDDIFIIKSLPDLQHLGWAPKVIFNGIYSFDRDYHDAWQAAANRILDDVAERTKAHAIDLTDVFCDAEKCYIGDKKNPFFRDDNHVNAVGSRMIWKKIGAEVVEILSDN